MIRGEFTFLRAIERDDLRKLLTWRNNPNFRKYFREYRELNWDQQVSWYENVVLNNDNVRMFSILNFDEELIGACGLCCINWVNRSADFSVYIGLNNVYIDYENSVDASKSLIKYGFDELQLHRIWAEIYDFDTQKSEMFKTLGFNLDGRHRETHWTDGRWCDSLFFSLLNTKKRDDDEVENVIQCDHRKG